MNGLRPNTPGLRSRVSDIDGVCPTTIGTTRFDPENGTLEFDARAREIFDAPVGRPGLEVWLERVHPEDLALVGTMYADCVESLGTECLYRIIVPDGRTRYILTRSMFIDRHHTTRPGVLTAIVLEVDPAVASDTVLTRVLDRVSLGFAVLDADMTLVYLNAQGENHLGVRRGEVLGRHVHDALPLTKGSFLDELHETALTARCPATLRTPSLYAPGRTVEVTANYVDGNVAFDFRDVTDQVEQTSRLIDSYRSILDRARYDDLTGVLGRATLLERLAGNLGESSASAALLFVDVDDFKTVNDTYGHAVGDLVLRTVAQRMVEHCGPFDVLGRIGGDEFIVGLFARPASGLRRAAEDVCSAIEADVRTPIAHGDHHIEVTVSVGVALTKGPTDLADLLADADADLYRKKRTLH
ncbi:diguanylate cyclase domain-containing protein [Rhodococcoides corynebacterioides]|uniref:diguanylate cyclase domain-containing protein n=1 Tax=Rhodococcoides corynebacterioides TaxID=53972 RepID=UPI003F7FE289